RWVKLRPGAAKNLFARCVEAASLAIGAVAGDRVHRVGHGEYAGADRNFIPSQPAWVAVPVVVLLVGIDNCGRLAQEGDLAQNVVAPRAVVAPDLFFFGGQLARLAQDLIRNRHLADIVQEGTARDDLDFRRWYAHRARQGN